MEFSVLVKELAKAMRTEAKSERVFWQPWLDREDSSKQSSNKQLPTTKWKRDRRSRLPEYSRKSDPKIAETFGTEPASPTAEAPNQQANGQDNAPLDMSVRQRGLPPSYSQTVNNPGYRSSYRPSVIQNNAPNREDLPPGISMCDPIIDEHFRRSLGNDYLSLFSNNNVSREPMPVKPAPKVSNTTNVIELMDTAGLSVDDHFAKALGDTWVKLNKKEQEIKNSTSENHGLVTI
ncbi:uncharacterized protein BDFB_001154 [Asbolus verrucosus]|uniref:Transcription cofactor vestigial-like protein 4 n=1 Tax=Asbolus verrucosus TaxID=1661398 RepID=A0A482W713_ASBVE|nr:uncharacterized protein BDFB_001154 [Asbolus verrucosus]